MRLLRRLPQGYRPSLKLFLVAFVGLALLYGVFLSLPPLLALKMEHDRTQAASKLREQFPVSVDPRNKVIVENTTINTYLNGPDSPLQASAAGTNSILADLFAWLATSVANTPLYQATASADGRFVTISAGMRKEQVASAFATALGWTKEERQQFLAAPTLTSLATQGLSEGIFSPGIYLVSPDASPAAARSLVGERFKEEILARYGREVVEAVPLKDALTVASLIQREAAGPSDMRFVSGVIWNRLFIDMRLQIDATVQYARANAGTASWWPAARPADLFIKSPYNTYVHKGLPPGPISNPSVAAVVAALNPVVTDCLFYFHDRLGGFHCSPDYAGHVAKLKQQYGQGK